MNPADTAYQAALHPLMDVLLAVPEDAWDNPSPCEGWTARQVIAHLIDTQRDLFAGHGHDPGPPPQLTDPAVGLQEHARWIQALIVRDDVVDKEYDGFFGPTTVGATLVQFYVWDMLVHRWDIARATGGNETLGVDELDRIEAGADSFGEALHMDGICGPAVAVPVDAERQVRALARLGRVASWPSGAVRTG